MPTPAAPRHYHCPACHWSKTVVPQSDVLMPDHDIFHCCPQCGHAPLDVRAVGSWAAGVGSILDMFSRWLKR